MNEEKCAASDKQFNPIVIKTTMKIVFVCVCVYVCEYVSNNECQL